MFLLIKLYGMNLDSPELSLFIVKCELNKLKTLDFILTLIIVRVNTSTLVTTHFSLLQYQSVF